MTVQLTDGTSNNVVDPTSKGILVQNPKVPTQAGYVVTATLQDAGAVTGAPTVRSQSTSIDGRLSVGLDTPFITDLLNYTAQNTANWSDNLTTMAVSYAAGGLTLNSGASVASGAFAVHKSYATVPLFGAGSVHMEARLWLTQVPQVNNTVYIGMGLSGTTAAPTDGAYFAYSAAGVLNAVLNWNGTTAVSSALTAPAVNTIHEVQINVADDNAEFWIDGVLQAILALPAGAGTPSLTGAAAMFVQNTNTGAVATAQQVKIFSLNVWLYDVAYGRPWAHSMAAMGCMGYQGQSGGTMGSTALYANNANPTAAVPTNTTAALGSGLGGLFFSTNSLAVTTDGIISSYQNPVGSVTQTPRKLIITGVRIDSAVQATIVGPPLLSWSLAFGHTAVSLATAEGATTKAPRRIALGIQFFSALTAGIQSPPIVVTFQSPIVVNPGEFVQAVMKNIGTVGTSGTLAHAITFDSYWE
jgi:hypothetical protein